jgi:signal transduction histidine kinase
VVVVAYQTRKQQQVAIAQSRGKNVKPVSLRVKLLIGFSVVFSVVFAGAFFWFYTYTTDKILTRLRKDLLSTLKGAVAGVDVAELMALYAEGEPNAEGFSDDPRYQRQLQWFQTVHNIEPRVWLYSYVVKPKQTNPPASSSIAQSSQSTTLEVVYLVDLWSVHDPSKAARFLESGEAGGAAHQIYKHKQLVETPEIYQDEWGSWLSAFAPLQSSDREAIPVLGLDIEADYVVQVQTQVRNRFVIAFVITYSILFVLIYGLSGVLTRRLYKLTQSAEQIGTGNYGLDLSALAHSRFPDEMNTLATVFESMVEGIRTRERLIVEGKRAEDEMRLALQEERELNELKSRFVSMVSHELRTPLTVIRTSLELLERYGHLASDEKKEEYFQRSRTAVETMIQLLEDVLTIGKAEAGKLGFNPAWLNLEKFCRELVEEMQLGIGANYTILFVSQGTCGEACIDPYLLRSILTNLLSNAIKYSPVNSQIDFRAACQEQHVVFDISDRGIGIPQIDQPMLFELFHRASNVSAIRGTGLGLAIVKQCVKLHRGQITFVSQEGVGTTFTVKLPRQREEPIQLDEI